MLLKNKTCEIMNPIADGYGIIVAAKLALDTTKGFCFADYGSILKNAENNNKFTFLRSTV